MRLHDPTAPLVCFDCKQEKLAVCFYLVNGKRRGPCKSCKKVRVKEWTIKNPNKRKAIWRAHAEANRESYRAANRRYYRRDPESYKQRLKKIWDAHPEKREARKLVRLAVLRGDMVKLPCEKCGEEKVQAHHADYSRPLDVRWLCSICHGKEHRRDAA